MPWARGTSLLSIADFKNLAMQAGVMNLGTDGELDVAAGLQGASDAIFDQVKARDGVDPTLLTNSDAYKRVVAEFFLATLCRRGLIDPPAGRDAPAVEFEWSDPYRLNIAPEVSSGSSPRVGAEGIPCVGHASPGQIFSGDGGPGEPQYFSDDIDNAR